MKRVLTLIVGVGAFLLGFVGVLLELLAKPEISTELMIVDISLMIGAGAVLWFDFVSPWLDARAHR
jgi:hypothetical protein